MIPALLWASSPAQRVYEAYISGNMGQWKRVLNEVHQQKNPSPAQVLERVNFQYGYIAWCIGNKKTSEAREWIPRMENDLERLEKSAYSLASVYAYRAALYGYRIGVNKLQAPFLGPKSNEYAQKAIKTDPKNPLGYQQYGNILFYTPFLFGGSKEDAGSHLLKSMELMESIPESLQWNWNYLSLLTAIAEMYYETNQRAKAVFYLRKTLKKEPNYQWVKNELLPVYLKN
jgi:tetratricopeptide (TPR) repeat protein